MLKHYYNDIPKDQQPAKFIKLVEKNKEDFDKIAAKIFKKSFLVDKDKTLKFLEKPNTKKLAKDPMYNLMATMLSNYFASVRGQITKANESLAKAKRLYVKGLMEMNKDKAYASD